LKEIERVVRDILMGGEEVSLLEKEKAEDILSALLFICENMDFYEGNEVAEILEFIGDKVAKVFDIVGDRIISEAILLKLKDIDKMLVQLNELDHHFTREKRTQKYSAAQLGLTTKLIVLKSKKQKK
jgi:hypothetical protein